jgi:hypothetical protein
MFLKEISDIKLYKGGKSMDKNPMIGVSIIAGVLLVFGLMTPITAEQIYPTTALYQGSLYQILQPTKDNNDTVTIIIKSGLFDMETQKIRGILGYTVYIENRGTKELWFNSSAVQYTLFSHQHIETFICAANVFPGWGYHYSRISILYLRPFMTITVRATVNTSTNLTLERSSIELFSSFFIGWTGTESVTGPS